QRTAVCRNVGGGPGAHTNTGDGDSACRRSRCCVSGTIHMSAGAVANSALGVTMRCLIMYPSSIDMQTDTAFPPFDTLLTRQYTPNRIEAIHVGVYYERGRSVSPASRVPQAIGTRSALESGVCACPQRLSRQ